VPDAGWSALAPSLPTAPAIPARADSSRERDGPIGRTGYRDDGQRARARGELAQLLNLVCVLANRYGVDLSAAYQDGES
jgi:hypothetical protein